MPFLRHCRYEAYAYGDGKTEKVASGLLEQLLLHLPGAKAFQSDGSNDNFILQLPENLRGSLWFTKSTLTRSVSGQACIHASSSACARTHTLAIVAHSY